MPIIDRGSGPPLVLIPGLQGRWEYMRPAVEALSVSFRVITFSLQGADLDGLVQQAVSALDRAEVERATICGVSFGGLVAVRFAARQPSRCATLVLASTPRPSLQLRRRHQIYLKAPWIFGPVFVAESPLRLRPEIRVAIPNARARFAFSLAAAKTLLSAPISLSTMAARAKVIATTNLEADCARIAAPALILTGEPHLDHVVPVEGSAIYQRLIPHARTAVLAQTGHLGSITRPHEFAAIVRDFVEGHRDAAA
jgi:pimeloyl-ACP methyl ester carboxylesterase